MITVERVKRFAPNARADLLKAVVDGWPTMDACEINTPLRVAHFMAQIATETGGLKQIEENLNYSARRLTEVWPSRFPTIAAAQPYANNPRKLANKVYGTRLGNRGGDDGWNYRGGGFLQETGRANYRARGVEIGQDLEAHPELLRDPKTAFAAAVASWLARGCNELADEDDVVAVRKAINGGAIGLDECRKWLKRAKQVWRDAPAAVGLMSAGDEDRDEPDPAGERVDPDDLPPVGLTEPISPVLAKGYPTAVVRSVQQQLCEMGYFDVGKIDGNAGGKTAGAIAGFMIDRGLGSSGELNDDSMAAIDQAHAEGFRRPIAPARADASVKDVAANVPAAKHAWLMERVMKGWTWFTGGGAVSTYAAAQTSPGQKALAWAASVPGYVWLALLFGGGLLAWKLADRLLFSNVADYQTGKRA